MKNSQENQSQIELFSLIQKTLPEKDSLVYVVSDVLGPGIDATYRRIRGSKPMSLEEAAKLSRHFKVSIDAAIGMTVEKGVMCECSPKSIDNLKEYSTFLQTINSTFERYRRITESEILLSVDAVHTFNLLAYKELTFFTLFSFHKNLCGFSSGYDKFVEEIHSDELLRC